MAYILNLETATKNCSVSIAKDGITIAYREIAEQGYSHAERLHVFIEEVLKEANLSYADLSAVAVSKGPGSYTGLRIGVSAAKGLCYALSVPLIAIDTLEILAQQLSPETVKEGSLIIPMIDARRMEVYSAIFDSSFQKIRDVEAEIISESSFADITQAVYFVGDCAEKCRTILTAANFIFVEDIIYPSAKEMSALSFIKHKKSDTVDVAYFEPYYLKDFFMARKL